MYFRNLAIYVSLFILANAASVLACWGIRPLSMGGAFVAVADDVHSIYWNPAGLSKVPGVELTYTRLLNLRAVERYDDFVAIAVPLKYGTLGISYTYNFDDRLLFGNKDNWMAIGSNEHYVNLGYGFPLTGNMAVGINLKLLSVDIDVKGILTGEPFQYCDGDTIVPLDIGFLWAVTPRFSLGVLCQNFNEPVLKLANGELKYIFNLRPGMAWRPNDRLIFALEVYDMLDNTNGVSGRDVSLGMEAKVTEHVVLRTGGYHINNSRKGQFTAGIGFRIGGCKIDYGIMTGSDFGEATHWLSLGYSF